MSSDPRVLTVRQPWAAAIIHGAKTVENRDWRTSYRGRLYIHTALAADEAGDELYALPQAPGAIIGHAELWDVAQEIADLTLAERRWANPARRFYWRLRDPVAITPVRCRGSLGLWKPPEGFTG